MNMNNEATLKGIGKTERRRMIKRWKEEGLGLSLRAWARRQHPVGDSAHSWIQAKTQKGGSK